MSARNVCKRHAPFFQPFGAGDFGAAQPAGHHDLDPQSPALHGPFHGPFHGPAEPHLFFQLHGHPFGHQLRVHFGTFDLDDLNSGFKTRHFFDHAAQAFDVRAFFSDDQTGPRGVNVHPQILARPFNADLRYRREFQTVFQKFPDLEIFLNEGGHLLEVKPLGVPLPDVSEPYALGMRFIAQTNSPLSLTV